MITFGGVWRHYKGHTYELLGIAKHSETAEELGLAYKRLDAEEIFIWVRPEAMWRESVEMPDGKSVARFELLSTQSETASLKQACEALKTRVADLEQQLHEPGYVDALREACQGCAALVPQPFRKKYADEGDDYDQLESLPHLLERYIGDLVKWSEDDLKLPEDDQIEKAHPVTSNEHDCYKEAHRMVSAKRSKFALVDLVNWLLVRLKAFEGR